MRLRSEINLRSQILTPYRTLLRTLRGHDAPTTRNKRTHHAICRASLEPLALASTSHGRAVGAASARRARTASGRQQNHRVDNATTRVALRLRWQTGAFDGGDDSVECTRESDGTWTGDEQSRWQTDRKSASRGNTCERPKVWGDEGTCTCVAAWSMRECAE